jgi:hypothetical protein
MIDKPATSIRAELARLRAANMRLRIAIAATVSSWPKVDRCWIDEITTEPTVDLGKHRIKDGNGS